MVEERKPINIEKEQPDVGRSYVDRKGKCPLYNDGRGTNHPLEKGYCEIKPEIDTSKRTCERFTGRCHLFMSLKHGTVAEQEHYERVKALVPKIQGQPLKKLRVPGIHYKKRSK